MEAIEGLDKECSALGGLFQQVVNDMKAGVPHYEDLVNKAAKLHTHLKNTILVLGAFLDSFQKIADSATNTKGATRDIGSCLTRIVIRHKAMEAKMKTLCSALLDCMVLPMQDKLEEWRKSAALLDKEHAKEYKKLRSEIRKRSEAVQRAQKKQNKKKSSSDSHHAKAVDASVLELTKNLKTLEDTEKSAVRRVLTEERSRYCTFVACLRPVLEEEVSMVSDFQQLEEINKKLAKSTDDPFKLPPSSEQVILDMKSIDGNGGFAFQTPPSSPSSLGSRKSSMCSISSAGSSTGSPSHQPQISTSTSKVLRNKQGSSGGNLGPLRLSSVSSQDSGFTSQDTLFLRPGSPRSQNGGVKHINQLESNGERPHTISSAYEKGHQRTQLQPYTFSPPESTLTIRECDPDAAALEGVIKKPPVPQRCGPANNNMDRPSVPNKTLAATMAAAKQQQLQMQMQQMQQQQGTRSGGLPNFHINKNDMVVPQPVYMNMSDLAAMAAQKAQLQQQQDFQPALDDSPELKTPTAEELIVPEQKAGDGGSSTSESSLGSSSGYGSQSTVRLEEQQQQPNINTTTAATQDGFATMPNPAPLLDDSKYRSLSRTTSSQNTQQQQQQLMLQYQHQQQQHPANRVIMHRPYSFTSGMIPEMPEEPLGMNPSNVATLRRAQMHTSSQVVQQQGVSKPPPPTRRTPSVCSQTNFEQQSFTSNNEDGIGSNSTTPRGSMEHLPPPPPHLLHSDDDDMPPPPPPAPADASANVIAKRGRSVAESVRALQQSGHMPCSPKSLRRAHSVAGSPFHNQNSRAQQEQQIYAPVAHLQQKIQQRQQLQFQPYPQQQSPEGEQYGFGMQFQQSQCQFYQQMVEAGLPMQSPPEMTGQQPYGTANHDQLMRDIDAKMRLRPGAAQNQRSNYDMQTAMRVRRWIESKSVTNVAECRPVLNAEIHQGFALRKTSVMNDRSAPRF